ILGIGKGILRVFSFDFPLLGVSPIPVVCSMILTLDFPLLEAEVALIVVPSVAIPHGLLLPCSWIIIVIRWKELSESLTLPLRSRGLAILAYHWSTMFQKSQSWVRQF
ncbi:hypothetical protein L208DRAFT_1331257, partial [Tricholoma matsutake]